MNVITQYKIKNNLNNLRYLRENSLWYKYLNRNKNYIYDFESEMKERYKLTTNDRIQKVVNGVEMVTKVLDIFN